MKNILTSIFMLTCHFYVYSQSREELNYSKEIQDKIKEVEQSVSLNKFQIEGKSKASLEERMKLYHVKGLSVAVIKDYKVEWAKGYGLADSAEQKLVTTETLFEPGSISKSINAMGVLKLVEDGKLSLNKDVNDYLKSWKFPYDKKYGNKKITIENLLTHSAGLGVHGFYGYEEGDSIPSLTQILDGIKPANSIAIRSVNKPGKQFSYSGGGTLITQLIQMDISQLSYENYIRETVFKPLGMSNSSFSQPFLETNNYQLATGYHENGTEVIGKHHIYPEQAAAGLWTTPSDLSKFIIEIQLSLKGKSNKILSEKLTNKMLTPIIQDAGLGVFIENKNGTKYFQHSASNVGFGGMYYGSLEGGNGVVVFINSDGGFEIIEELIDAVAQVYRWDGFYKERKLITKKVVEVPDSILNTYVGTYRWNTIIATIYLENNQLKYKAGINSWNAYFSSPSEFFNLESTTEKTFQKDSLGQIIGFLKLEDGKNLGMFEKIAELKLTKSLEEKLIGNYDDGENKLKILKIENDLVLIFGNDDHGMKLHFISESEFYLENDYGAICSIKLDDSLQKVTSIIRCQEKRKMVIKKVK